MFTLSLGLALSCASATMLQAKDVPLAAALPAETFFYATFDAAAAAEGVRNLDLARLLRDPEVTAALADLMSSVDGLDAKDPVGSALAMSPHAEWLAGEFSIGLAGFEFARGAPDGESMRLSPNHPFSAKLAHSLAMLVDDDQAMGTASWFSIDGLLALEPGEQLRSMAREFLAAPPAEFQINPVNIGGREVTSVDIAFPDGKHTRFYADLSGPRWIIGGLRSTFEAAMRGGRQDSLANTPSYQRFRSRLVTGTNAVFAMLDVKRLAETFRAFIPPIALEEMQLLGLDTLRGLGLGLSFTEGSVRESILVAFDGEPRGILAPLSALSGGLATLESAPGNTAFYAGIKLDLQQLIAAIRSEADILLPGSRKLLDDSLAEVKVGSLDLIGDILPTFGGELSLALGVPERGPIPDARFVLDLRDPSRFPKFLEFAKENLGAEGVEIRPLPLPDGSEGFSLFAPGAPVQPAFAISGNQLIGAISGYALRSSNAKEAKSPGTTLASDENFATLRRAFAGCPQDGAAFWMHVDLGKVIPMIYDSVAPLLGAVAAEEGLAIDTAQLPLAETIAPYFKSLAIALHCDEGGISIDAVSPTGLLGLGVAVAIIEAQQRAAFAEFEDISEFEVEDGNDMGDDSEEPSDDGMDDGSDDDGGGKSDN
jgi:hypothetical protein